MQANSPWTFLNAVQQLTQANMNLFNASSMPLNESSQTRGLVNPFELSVLFMQGLTKNYVQFIHQINADAFSVLMAARGVMVPVASGA